MFGTAPKFGNAEKLGVITGFFHYFIG